MVKEIPDFFTKLEISETRIFECTKKERENMISQISEDILRIILSDEMKEKSSYQFTRYAIK